MAFNTQSRNWYAEQVNLINNADEATLSELRDPMSYLQESAVNDIEAATGVNVSRDWKGILEKKEVRDAYRQLFLEQVCEEIAQFPTDSDVERVHLESVANELGEAWDKSMDGFIQESYNVANYLPLSTIDFPALVKQFIKFLGKDLIPVQTAPSTNIEQRIFTKYLVNNQTGEEFETPRVYFDPEMWKKLWYAGKGYRLDDTTPLMLSAIYNATGRKIQLLDSQYLLDENGQHPTDFVKTIRTRLSYDLNIRYVLAEVASTEDAYEALTEQPADWSTAYTSYYELVDGEYTAIAAGSGAPTFEAGKYFKKIPAGSPVNVKLMLPGNGIDFDVQNNGVFLNGFLDGTKALKEVDANGKATGATYVITDHLAGIVDFVKGTITASSCGTIKGIFLDGYISNETNLRTIGFREYPSIRKFLIGDGCRFQLPFTVEDFAEANASLNFNLYNRLVQQLVTAQEMTEDEYILQELDKEFNKYDGVDSDIWDLESYTHTEYADIDPTFLSTTFAGDPFEYRANIIHNAINTVIYSLCDMGKLDNLGFVVYCNPLAARLIQPFVTWTTHQSTEIAGVKMNHAFGVVTDSDVPIRVVSSNRVPAYIDIDAYQTDDPDYVAGAKSKEYFYKIVAYPMDKFHITYKHLRFARHLTNSPENAGYQDAQNPGGQAMLITTSSQYKTIHIQGIQGRVILKNSALTPDVRAGLVKAANA